jgi:hypothetical protein
MENNNEGFSSEGDTEIICNNAGRILWGAAAFVGAIGVAAGIIYGIANYYSSYKSGSEKPSSGVENSELIKKVKMGK